jgi:hypothetical protein
MVSPRIISKNTMLELLISSLAVWRISSLLVHEDGPADVFAKLRMITGMKYNEHSIPYGTNIISSLLSCVWCVSIWVAAFIAILDKPANIHTFFRRAMASSAIAIMIDEIINRENNG